MKRIAIVFLAYILGSSLYAMGAVPDSVENAYKYLESQVRLLVVQNIKGATERIKQSLGLESSISSAIVAMNSLCNNGEVSMIDVMSYSNKYMVLLQKLSEWKQN